MWSFEAANWRKVRKSSARADHSIEFTLKPLKALVRILSAHQKNSKIVCLSFKSLQEYPSSTFEPIRRMGLCKCLISPVTSTSHQTVTNRDIMTACLIPSEMVRSDQ